MATGSRPRKLAGRRAECEVLDGLLVAVGATDEIARGIVAAYEHQEQLGVRARHTVTTRYSSQILYSRLSNMIQAV